MSCELEFVFSVDCIVLDGMTHLCACVTWPACQGLLPYLFVPSCWTNIGLRAAKSFAL